MAKKRTCLPAQAVGDVDGRRSRPGPACKCLSRPKISPCHAAADESAAGRAWIRVSADGKTRDVAAGCRLLYCVKGLGGDYLRMMTIMILSIKLWDADVLLIDADC